MQFKITQCFGLPSFFSTGSCAEFNFKSLHRLNSLSLASPACNDKELSERSQIYEALQEHSHIVAHYFDLRTQAYVKHVMRPVFGVDAYWYRHEFAKSRGIIPWHGLCWRSDRQPYAFLFDAVNEGLTHSKCTEKLAIWATSFHMTASHPLVRST